MAKNRSLQEVGAFLLVLPLALILTATDDFASAVTMDAASSFGDNNYESILFQLGFHRFASAIPSFSKESVLFTTWNGPFTIFAPPDESFPGLNNPEVLAQYVVPGLFSFSDLKTLTVSTKLETMSPGRCLSIASGISINRNNNTTHVWIYQAEIVRPDMFNNGFIIVHGLNEHIYSLTPCTCSFNSITLSFPLPRLSRSTYQIAAFDPPLMRSMLRDAMLRLGTMGYGISALAIKNLYSKLVNLQNATVFAIPDASIFPGGHGNSYVSNVKYHIVPNLYLETHDLKKLPFGKVLRTLDDLRQVLLVTTRSDTSVSINMQRIKRYEVMKNLKIVVHSSDLPLKVSRHYQEFDDRPSDAFFALPVPRYRCGDTLDLAHRQLCAM